MDLIKRLSANPFVLAPMAGITDSPFRSFMREMGCSLVISELVSSHGLRFNSEKTFKLMKFKEEQRPVGIQIFGETPEILAQAAKVVEVHGADFVDLNFGCPVKKVVKKGAGSAILKDLKQLRIVLSAVKSATNIPVTIKIRTGWDNDSRNAEEVCQIAYDEGITWVGIHGRSRAAGYSGLADWDYIGKVKAKSKIPILGNGDLTSAKISVERIKKYSLDGVMIGRGSLKNPWIFQQCLHLWKPDEHILKESKLYTAFMCLKGHLEEFYDERLVMLQMKKFASWFSAGYPESAQFRKSLFSFSEKLELQDYICTYLENTRNLSQQDTSHEAFLMGGHG